MKFSVKLALSSSGSYLLTIGDDTGDITKTILKDEGMWTCDELTCDRLAESISMAIEKFIEKNGFTD